MMREGMCAGERRRPARQPCHGSLHPWRPLPFHQDQHEPGPVALWWEALMLYVPLNIIGFLLLPMTAFQRRFQVRVCGVCACASS